MNAFRGAVVALLGLFLVALFAAPVPAAGPSTPVSVTVDRTEISTPLGHTVVFRSTIRNDGPHALHGLIAHLNVLSLRDGVYVDPEDWSSRRTRYLGALPAGSSKTLTWPIHAVNAGTLGLYVAVLAGGDARLSPAASPVIHLAVAEKRTLNAGGILPLALGVPALVGLLMLGVRVSRRRRSIR